ncbi:hypothetical protein BC332_24813 [Capsicum chinense]|nr:hypothetical protein BC332_24813 [Capsicum chinense]
MNDIVLGVSGSESLYISMQKMHPFKRVTGDKIDYCPYGLYRALLTPVHRQLRDHDNNDLLKQTHSIFSFHRQDSYYRILKSELIHFKLLKFLELRHIEIDNFPLQILRLIWLRYLSLQCIQLETLSFIYCDSESFIYCDSELLPESAKAFPAMLKKLKLERTSLRLRWSYLDIIAELPKLEVLKLMDYAAYGKEWHPNVRGFTRLKLLLIEHYNLKYRKATNDKFPVLERLVLKECRRLKEIPIEFAEIHTLQLIELTRCLPELGESAARNSKEQDVTTRTRAWP